MDPLEIQAILNDLMTPTLEAITAGVQQLADTASAAMGQFSDAMTQAAASSDALQASVDANTASLTALSGSIDASTAATNANTTSTDANAASAKNAAASHSKLATAANAMILPLAIATAAVVGIGVASVHMAGDFQEGVDSLVTGAGESQSNLQLVSDGIMNLSEATGESTKQLIGGMYMIESAGYHGKAGLAVLTAAAEGAKVGQADLGVVADGTTTIMTDFAKSGVTATQAVNLLVATVASGKTHMQDLSKSLAQILPTAASAGIGLKDVMGAMATMTAEGVPAANAATYLRQTIIALEAPSKGTIKALESVGLTTGQVAAAMHKSLPGALQMITEAVAKKFPVGSAAYVAALKNIAGGSKQMQGILDLTGDHMTTFAANAKKLGGAVASNSKSVTGWALTQHAFNTQMAQAGATVQVAMIKLGEALMPVVEALVQNLMPVLQWMIAHGPIVATVLGTLAAVLGGALVAALYAAAAAWWAVNSAAVITLLPFIAIGAAIGLVIAGVVLLITHWKQVSAWLEGVWSAVVKGVGSGFSWLGTQAHNAVTTVGNWFSWLGTQIHDRIMLVVNVVRTIWATIPLLFQAGLAKAEQMVQQALQTVVGWFAWLFNHNYYFHDLVVGIQRDFAFAQTIIQTIWTTITGWLTTAWANIQHIAEAAFALVKLVAQRDWEAVQRFIITPIERAWARIQLVAAAIQLVLQTAWNRVKSDVEAAWNRFVATITGAGDRARSAVQDHVVTPITSAVSNLIGLASGWGSKLIQMLISGIQSEAGALKNAASNIAKNIASFLGFHSPAEEGPGADADQWMPNMLSMLTTGLRNGTPAVSQAASAVADALAAPFSGGRGSAGGLAGAGGAAALTGAGGGAGSVQVILTDQTASAGFTMGLRLLAPNVRAALAQEIAQEMARQGFLQGRQPIAYTGHN